jgi:hypothetical protein
MEYKANLGDENEEFSTDIHSVVFFFVTIQWCLFKHTNNKIEQSAEIIWYPRVASFYIRQNFFIQISTWESNPHVASFILY